MKRLRGAIGIGLIGAAVSLVAITGCENPNEPIERLVVLEVDPTIAACASVTSGGGYGYGFACMMVRELRAEEWETLPFGAIEGFSFDAGYRYRLLVGVRRLADPPEEGPAHGYRLVRIIERTSVFLP